MSLGLPSIPRWAFNDSRQLAGSAPEGKSMNSSGITRGLAVSAIAALALSGLAMAPASAQTVGDGLSQAPNNLGANPDANPDVVLFAPFDGAGLSQKSDGVNATVTLLAGTPTNIDPDGGGAQTPVFSHSIRFEYSTDGGATYTTINTIPVDRGVATTQWAPVAGTNRIRAQAVTQANAPLGNPDVSNVTVNPNGNPVYLNPAAGAVRTPLGVYAPTVGGNGTIAVTGKTGDPAPANTRLSVDGPRVAGPIEPLTTNGAITSGADAAGMYSFAKTLTVDATNIPVDAPSDLPDDVIVTVDNGLAGSTDGQVYALYRQRIENLNQVTAPVSPGYQANVNGDVNAGNAAQPSGGAPDGNAGNDISKYDITVKDQNGAPVAGVPIYQSNSAGNPAVTVGQQADGTNDPGGPVASNFFGVRTVTLRENTIDMGADTDGVAGQQTAYYVVDVNANGTYQNTVDVLIPVVQTNAPAAVAKIELTNNLGTAQDDDETGTVTIKVTDANGNPVQNVVPNVTVTRTSGTNPPVVTNPVVAPTNNQGNTTVTAQGFDDVKTLINIVAKVINGTTGSIDIESDRSAVVWDNGALAQALAGSSTTETGKLRLPSGKTLGGRILALTLTRTTDANGNGVVEPGDNGDAFFAATADQPAGTITGGALNAQTTTSATGTFAVKITDPSPAPGAELDDIVTAASAALSDAGDTVSTSMRVDFIRSLTATRIEITNPDGAPNQADGLASVNFPSAGLNNDIAKPGALSRGEVRAFNADGVLLDVSTVNVTLNEGFFVDVSSVATAFDGTPTAGALVDYKDAGKARAVSAVDGVATFYTTIERNAGFDDDGTVADKINATVGSVSDVHDLTWTTDFASFGGGQQATNLSATDPIVVSLNTTEQTGTQQSSILPKARASAGSSAQVVDFDVVTKDVFGNRTSSTLNVTDDSPIATFIDPEVGGPVGIESDYTVFQPAIRATSNRATNQKLEVEVNGATKFTYTANIATSAVTATPLAPGNFNTEAVNVEDFSDADPATAGDQAINWYEVNVDASTFVLEQEGPESVPVGTPVSYTVKAIDQEGQDLRGYGVGFLRVGPGDDGEDDDGQVSDCTNNNGQAFYDFVGSEADEAFVSAVIYDDIPSFGLQCGGNRLFVVGPDTVTFTGDGGENPGPVDITAIIKAKNTADGKDKISVRALGAAKGAKVRLFLVKNGERELFRTGNISDQERKVFILPDRGDGSRTFFAVVEATDTNNADRTKAIRIS